MKISVRKIENIHNVGIINFSAYPELDIYAGIEGKEIQFSILIEPLENISHVDEISSDLLCINKKMNLSTFGITEVDGKEWYEIFGQVEIVLQMMILAGLLVEV